jgi:hypothetical protein
MSSKSIMGLLHSCSWASSPWTWLSTRWVQLLMGLLSEMSSVCCSWDEWALSPCTLFKQNEFTINRKSLPSFIVVHELYCFSWAPSPCAHGSNAIGSQPMTSFFGIHVALYGMISIEQSRACFIIAYEVIMSSVPVHMALHKWLTTNHNDKLASLLFTIWMGSVVVHMALMQWVHNQLSLCRCSWTSSPCTCLVYKVSSITIAHELHELFRRPYGPKALLKWVVHELRVQMALYTMSFMINTNHDLALSWSMTIITWALSTCTWLSWSEFTTNHERAS